MSFNGNYVWSHFLDDQDSAGWGGRGGTQTFQNAYKPAANYGNSNFDVRNALKGSLVYQLPVGRGRRFLNSNPYLNAIVGGWQTSATMVVHSGQPFTVSIFQQLRSGQRRLGTLPSTPTLLATLIPATKAFITGITSQPSPNQLQGRLATRFKQPSGSRSLGDRLIAGQELLPKGGHWTAVPN